LFVDAPREWVRSVLAQVPLDLLQFHGEEDPDYCSAFTRPYIKAVRMRVGVDTVETARRYRTAAAWLFDSYAPNAPGGTGETFDWTRVPQGLEKPVVLAGGLTPENVGVAIRTVRPYAVDVSGGVEGQKGIKDIAKMAAFVRSVDYVDREQSDG
jgi:phosphoribosylanthranilate isomerase